MFGTLTKATGSGYQLGLFAIAAVAAVSFMFAIMFGNLIGAIIPVLGNKNNNTRSDDESHDDEHDKTQTRHPGRLRTPIHEEHLDDNQQNFKYSQELREQDQHQHQQSQEQQNQNNAERERLR